MKILQPSLNNQLGPDKGSRVTIKIVNDPFCLNKIIFFKYLSL